MPISFDRSGVPQYAGDPEDWKEYRERVLDFFHGCRYEDQKNAVIRLRSGLTSRAFESVRSLKHKELICRGNDETKTIINDEPLQKFLTAMETGVLPERPIRAAELYDRAVYGANVRRQPTETMADYCVRRNTDWDELTKVSSDTSVSSDLRGYMLLRFSGLSRQEQTQVLSSAGNSYELKGIEASLRLQHPYAQRYNRERRGPTAYAVDAEQDDESWDGYGDGYGYEDDCEDEGEYEEDVFTLESHQDEYEQELGDEIPVPDQSDEQELEVYAMMAQARHGRGRSNRPKGGGRGFCSSYGNAPPSSNMLPPAAGNQTEEDRSSKLRELKKKTQCLDCGRYGHWRGDAECSHTKESGGKSSNIGGRQAQGKGAKGGKGKRPKGGRKGKGGRGQFGGRRPIYAVFFDDDSRHDDSNEAYVVDRVPRKEIAPAPGRSRLDVDCPHCDAGHVDDTIRGANASSRYMICRPCNRRLYTQRRRHATQAWAWLVIGALYTQFGNLLRRLMIRRMGAYARLPAVRRRAPRARPTDAPMHAAATAAGIRPPPQRVAWYLRPETLVGTGPYADWRYDQIYEDVDPDIMGFCQTCVSDESTRNEQHEFYGIASYLRHHTWCGDWQEADILMADHDNVSSVAPAGLAVWDTACGLTVHSPSWRRRFVAELARRGLKAHRRSLQDHERVRGIGGHMQLSSCWVFPFGLYGVNGQITSYELDQPPGAKEIPMLISNTVQRQLLMTIALGDSKSPDSICFRAWGDTHYNLERAPNGNPASSLLDFPDEEHPGIKGLSECYTVVLDPTYDTWDGGDGKGEEEEETTFQADTAEQHQREDDEHFTNALQGRPHVATDVSMHPARVITELPGGVSTSE